MDLNILDISYHSSGEDMAIKFFQNQEILLTNNLLINNAVRPHGTCFHGTNNCQGKSYECQKKIKGKFYDYIRCNKCKKYKSIKNATFGGNIGNGVNKSFIPCKSKISYRKLLLIIFLWAKNISLTQSRKLFGNSIDKKTQQKWHKKLRNVCLNTFLKSGMIGGQNQIVQIDECFLRGRRKNNRGRILGGNRVPPARRNYGNAVAGPWVFGMVWVRQDGIREFKSFPVLRRDEATLKRLIIQNIAPGSIIYSDQWKAYKNISNWPQNYTHQVVNHSQNFVNPNNGVNTQRIESMWGWLKTKLIRCQRGVNGNLLPEYLAEFWWKLLHKDRPFIDIIEEIKVQFPVV